MPEPLYSLDRMRSPAYQLRYGWTGWFAPLDSLPDWAEALRACAAAWEADGIRVMEHRTHEDRLQLTASTKPSVSPVFLAGRFKGRLQHILRQSGQAIDFSRKVAVRSIGDNHTREVEKYIPGQCGKEPLADPRFRERLAQFTLNNPAVRLDQPTASNSGRYWYNLHLVLVVRQRYRIVDDARLGRSRDLSLAVAAKKGYGVSALSIMPDHLHLVIRGNIEHSPQEIALAYLNNLAYGLGQCMIWEDCYYAGTFGEYDMGAVRP